MYCVLSQTAAQVSDRPGVGVDLPFPGGDHYPVMSGSQDEHCTVCARLNWRNQVLTSKGGRVRRASNFPPLNAQAPVAKPYVSVCLINLNAFPSVLPKLPHSSNLGKKCKKISHMVRNYTEKETPAVFITAQQTISPTIPASLTT